MQPKAMPGTKSGFVSKVELRIRIIIDKPPNILSGSSTGRVSEYCSSCSGDNALIFDARL